jgi:hypothetical protein
MKDRDGVSGAPGEIRTPDPLLRSRVTTLVKTCRSERKTEDNQQVVTNADQLLAPSLSTLSSRFAMNLSQLLLRFHDGSLFGLTELDSNKSAS